MEKDKNAVSLDALREKLKKNSNDDLFIEIPHFPYKIINGKKFMFQEGCLVSIDPIDETEGCIIGECLFESNLYRTNEFAKVYLLNKKIYAFEDANGYFNFITHPNSAVKIENLKKSKKDYRQRLYDRVKDLPFATKEDLPIEPTTIYHCHNIIYGYYVNDNGDGTYTLWKSKMNGNVEHILTSVELEVIKESMFLCMAEDFSWIINRVKK